MLWLENKGILTCNTIVSKNFSETQKLGKECCETNNYVLVSADIYKGEKKNNYFSAGEYTEYSSIGNENDNQYIVKKYINPRYVSLAFLLESLMEKNEQKGTNLDLTKIFNTDGMNIKNDIKIIETLYKTVPIPAFTYFLQKNFVDVYFFIENVLPNIAIEEVERYTLDDLYRLREYAKKHNISSNCDQTLNNVDLAMKNSKILTFMNDIKLR